MDITALFNRLKELEDDYKASHKTQLLFGRDEHLVALQGFRKEAENQVQLRKHHDPEPQAILKDMMTKLEQRAKALSKSSNPLKDFIEKINQEPNKHMFYRGIARILQGEKMIEGVNAPAPAKAFKR
jgi:hypothetical protein